VAIAGLMPQRGDVPSGFDIKIEEGHDNSGALDDFMHGPSRAWWRKL